MAGADGMTDVHRALVQTMLARPVWSDDALDKAFNEIVKRARELDEAVRLPGNVSSAVNTINLALEQVGMRVGRVENERDGKKYRGLINTREDSIAETCTDLSPGEIEFFGDLLKLIVHNRAGRVMELQAVPEALRIAKRRQNSKASKLSLSDATLAVRKLAELDWLYKSYSDELGVGIRAFLELTEWIRAELGDEASDCSLCRVLVVSGQRCSNEECKGALHAPCARRLFSRTEQPKVCQVCRLPWVDDDDDDRDNYRIGDSGTGVGDVDAKLQDVAISADNNDRADNDDGDEPRSKRRRSGT